MSHSSILILVISILVLTCEVLPCSIEIPPLRKDFRRAEKIFVGEVLSVSETKLSDVARQDLPESWQNWNTFSNIKFRISKQWKGSLVRETEYTGVAYFYCGCPGEPIDEFKKGNAYLVFAEDSNLLTVCEAEMVGSEYVAKKMKRLDSFWFRTWSRVYPF